MPELTGTSHDDFATTHARLTAALVEQGFGVLTCIDLRATLHEKLGVEHEAHEILGVCNPQLAYQALTIDPDVALLLPCSVTLRDVGGATEVRVLDPERAFTLAAPATRSALEPLAREVRSRLEAVLTATVPDRVAT
ncbi:MAG: DUF302 domain-containing protein [Trueperaceae bacterium]|nr:DUF302 domain-containing protein [Trueperaceae bacterium]